MEEIDTQYLNRLEEYNKRIELNPNSSMLYFKRADFKNNKKRRTYEKNLFKDYQSAIEDYNKAIELGINGNFKSKLYRNRGNAKEALGDYYGAIEDYTMVLESKADESLVSSVLNYRGNTKSKLKDYEGALSDYMLAIAIFPSEANGYFNIGRIKMEQMKYEEAIDAFSIFIKLNPEIYDGYKSRGNAKFLVGDYQGAMLDYASVIRLKPNSNSYFERGLKHQKLQNYFEAVKDFNKAIELEKKIVNLYLILFERGKVKIEIKDYHGAILDYKKAIELNPDKVNEVAPLLSQLVKKAKSIKNTEFNYNEKDNKNVIEINLDKDSERSSIGNKYRGNDSSDYYDDNLDMDQQSPEFWDSFN